MKIDRWFKGEAVCGQRGYGGYQESGSAMPNCLWTRLEYNGMGHELPRMADIIRRHFGGRQTCKACEWSDILAVIHFNNAPETTREDVDKVMRIFSEEMESK